MSFQGPTISPVLLSLCCFTPVYCQGALLPPGVLTCASSWANVLTVVLYLPVFVFFPDKIRITLHIGSKAGVWVRIFVCSWLTLYVQEFGTTPWQNPSIWQSRKVGGNGLRPKLTRQSFLEIQVERGHTQCTIVLRCPDRKCNHLPCWREIFMGMELKDHSLFLLFETSG